MTDFNPPIARRALHILCEHFGYSPNYEQVKVMYMDLVKEVERHRTSGGSHTVESVLLTIISDELAGQLALWEGDVEEPEGVD